MLLTLAAASRAGAPPTAAGGPPQLRPLKSCQVHGGMVFGLAVDARHRQLVSGGKDSFLQVRGLACPGIMGYSEGRFRDILDPGR